MMVLADSLFLLNIASTWFMVGLIWLVQIVNYPQFSLVSADCYTEYYRAHVRRIAWVVALPMLLEAVTAVGMLWFPPLGVPFEFICAGMFLVFVIWLSTAFLLVPRHGALRGGFSSVVHSQLVALNWIRTLAWSARGVLVMVMLGLR